MKVAHSAIQPAKDAETNGQRVDVRLVFSVVLVIFWRCSSTKLWFIHAGFQFAVTLDRSPLREAPAGVGGLSQSFASVITVEQNNLGKALERAEK